MKMKPIKDMRYNDFWNNRFLKKRVSKNDNNMKNKPRNNKFKFNLKGKGQYGLLICIAFLIVLNITSAFILKTKADRELAALENENTTLKSQIEEIGTFEKVYYFKKPLTGGTELNQYNIESYVSEGVISSNKFSEDYITDITSLYKSFLKVDVGTNVPLVKSLITPWVFAQDDRYVDVITSSYPVELKEGDFIDIIISPPKGGNYLLLAEKRVTKVRENSIQIVVNFVDNYFYESATKDLMLYPGSTLYCVKYVEPSAQDTPIAFYPPRIETIGSMEMDPNVPQIFNTDLLLKRRRIFEKSLDVNEKEQSLILTGTTALLDKLMADMMAFRNIAQDEPDQNVGEENETNSNDENNIKSEENSSEVTEQENGTTPIDLREDEWDV